MFYLPGPVGKFCRYCGEWKPAHKMVKARGLLGFATECQQCAIKRTVAHRKRDLEAWNIYKRNWRKRRKLRTGIIYQPYIARDCKVCKSPLPEAAFDGDDNRCVGCKESRRRATSKYKSSSKGRAASRREYQTAHGKERFKKGKIVRRARERALPANITTKQWKAALNYFGHRCAICKRDLSGLFHRASADHWIPLTSPNCPGSVVTNIVPLCHAVKGGEGGCNNRKRNEDAYTWMCRIFGKPKADEAMQRIEAYFEWVQEQETEDRS